MLEGMGMFKCYGKKRTLFYLMIMALLNISYMSVLYTTGMRTTSAAYLEIAFSIAFLLGLFAIYYQHRLFVHKPLILQAILTQITLLGALFALDGLLARLFHIPIRHIYGFFLSPLVFMIVAMGYAIFALLFSNIINAVTRQYPQNK